MVTIVSKLQSTAPWKILLLPRLVASIVLLRIGSMHMLNPDHFRHILIASELPLVNLTIIVASIVEVVAGLLLLSGFLARLAGLLGVGVMLPAIYATVTLANLDPAQLPGDLQQIPWVPPLPLPIVVMVSSLLVLLFGAGAMSVDALMQKRQ